MKPRNDSFRPMTLAALLSVIAVVGSSTVQAEDWGCYDPGSEVRPGGSPASEAPSDALARAQKAWERKLVSNGRYMEQNCHLATATGTSWDLLPVQSCAYQSLGVQATVRMLNPSAEQLSAWTVNACLDVGAQNITACVDRLIDIIWQASNGQFPVAGYVVEPASAAGGTGNEALCLYFRDGVTATTKSSSTAPTDNRCDPSVPDTEQLTSAKRYARIASTTREMYVTAGGQEPVGRLGNVRWADVVGRLFREAWTSDRNFLLYARAMEERAAGRIQ